jgi:hypothetical protein
VQSQRSVVAVTNLELVCLGIGNLEATDVASQIFNVPLRRTTIQ